MKSGFVAVAGRPNVGKSTLVNALCGGKVAIVSEKPQTTRQRIFGIANGDGWQLVLADLPGFQRPRDALTERMQRTVDGSLADVDAILFVLDARDLGRGRGARGEGRPRDRLRRDRIPEADRDRQGRRADPQNRDQRAPGDRAPARPEDLPRAAGQSPPTLAPGRDDAGAARDLAASRSGCAP